MQKSFGRKKDVLVARCSSWYPRTHYAYECKFPFGRPRASQRLFVTQWHGRTYTRHTLDNRGRYERRAYLRTIHTCSRRSRSQFQPFRFPSTASAASADDSSCFPLFFPLLSTLHHPRLPLARISNDLDDRVPCHDYLPPSSLGLRDFCPAYRAPRPATCCLSTSIFLSIVQLYSTFFKLSTSVVRNPLTRALSSQQSYSRATPYPAARTPLLYENANPVGFTVGRDATRSSIAHQSRNLRRLRRFADM